MEKGNESALRKRVSLCLMGDHFTRVSKESLSVVLKGFVPSDTAHCNKRALNNFESWRSQIAVEESLYVLLTYDPKLICKYVTEMRKVTGQQYPSIHL